MSEERQTRRAVSSSDEQVLRPEWDSFHHWLERSKHAHECREEKVEPRRRCRESCLPHETYRVARLQEDDPLVERDAANHAYRERIMRVVLKQEKWRARLEHSAQFTRPMLPVCLLNVMKHATCECGLNGGIV